MTTYNEGFSLIGQKAKILIDEPAQSGLRVNDIVEIMSHRIDPFNVESLYNVKTIHSTHPRGFEKGNGEYVDYNWYVQASSLQIILEEENNTMETTSEVKAKKPRAKRASKASEPKTISGLDSSLVGAKVKIVGKGRYNDLDFEGTEEGLVTGVDATAYASEGGSFIVNFAKPCPYGTASISPKNLLLVSSNALETKDIKKLPKKHRELLEKERFPASREYVRILCAQVGVSIDDLPEITYLSMVTEKEKVAINSIFFEWKNSDKAKELLTRRQTISNEMKDALTKLASKTQRDYIAKIEGNLRSYEANAVQAARNVDQYLAQAAEERRKMDAFLKGGDGKTPANMFQYVEEIIRSGWFTFEEKLSRITSGSDCVLAFSTRDININYTRKELGVDINVDLGRFLVKYLPYNANINVSALEFNVCVGNYPHPHVSGVDNGNVCWGNGKQTYIDSMQSGNPVRAFETFQSLIQAYGDAPYQRIENFVDLYKQLNKTVKDTTGGDYVLNSLSTGYRCHKRYMPRMAMGSPDIVRQDDSYFYFRTWKRKGGSGNFMRTKENPNELVDLYYIYNNIGLSSCNL